MAQHPILDALGDALNRRQTTESLRSIADGTGVDYKRALAFSEREAGQVRDRFDIGKMATFPLSAFRARNAASDNGDMVNTSSQWRQAGFAAAQFRRRRAMEKRADAWMIEKQSMPAGIDKRTIL